MQPTASWAGTVMDSNDPQQLARFWADVLGYKIVEDSPGWVELMDPAGRRPHFTCQGINQHVQHGAGTSQGNRLHIDLGLSNALETDPAALAAFAERLEKLGGQPGRAHRRTEPARTLGLGGSGRQRLLRPGPVRARPAWDP